MRNLGRRSVLALIGTIALLAPLPALITPQPVLAQTGNAFYYQQITNIAESNTGSVGLPVLSADGRFAVFADAPGTADPATPNRIYRIGSDGSGLAEVDSFVPKCFCGAWVDVSADGSTVVSTESMQLRVTTGGNGATILEIGSNELSSLRLTAAGDRIAFILGRDTATVGSSEALVRGIYLIEADGSGLRLVAGPDQLAPIAGVAADQIGMLRLQPQALDISDDGGKLVFGAYIGGNQTVFSVNADGSGLEQLHEPIAYVQRVAISGDGTTAAMDIIVPETQLNEVSVVPAGGGSSKVLASAIATNQVDPIQLTRDGSRLLVSPSALLIETATGATTLLATPIEGLGGTHVAVIPDGLPRATMDADASIVLYAMRTVRCADCANLAEQLAVLTFANPPVGAPTISNPTIDPRSIANSDPESTVTISAGVQATDGELLGVSFTAVLPDGVIDGNFGSTSRMADDGTLGDATAGDGTYTQAGVVYVMRATRDPGPREMRIAAEVETADGYRYATAVDAGVLEVTGAAAERSG